jgi:hypothetical protein
VRGKQGGLKKGFWMAGEDGRKINSLENLGFRTYLKSRKDVTEASIL